MEWPRASILMAQLWRLCRARHNRHAFAINTLNQIKARANCPQQALPVLATYLGHRKYQYTAAYLKVKDAKDIPGLIAFTKSQLDVI